MGWIVESIKHGKGFRKRIVLSRHELPGYYSSGITIDINKSAATLYVHGWYDSFVGVEGGEVPLSGVLSLFPVDVVRKAVKLADEERGARV